MAKKQKNEETAVGEPAVGSAGLPPTSVAPAGSSVAIAPRPGPVVDARPGSAVRVGWLGPVGDTVVGSVQVLRGLLPASRVPVFLVSTALVVTGLVDPPVALGAGLALEALRRWEPSVRH